MLTITRVKEGLYNRLHAGDKLKNNNDCFNIPTKHIYADLFM